MRRTMRSRFSASLLLSDFGMVLMSGLIPPQYNRCNALLTRDYSVVSCPCCDPVLLLAGFVARCGVLLPLSTSSDRALSLANPGGRYSYAHFAHHFGSCSSDRNFRFYSARLSFQYLFASNSAWPMLTRYFFRTV